MKLLLLLALTGCASTTIYDAAGRPVIRIQGNVEYVRLNARGFEIWKLNHATPTRAAWQGLTRTISAAAPVAGAFAPTNAGIAAPAAVGVLHLLDQKTEN